MENPQSKQTYVKLNGKIEKWTGFFYFFLVKVSVPAVTMPQFIISFYLYFATDLGAEAFSLPYPMWCVLQSLGTTEKDTVFVQYLKMV